MKPTIPKGTRDFSPEIMVKRNYIFDIIREVYQLFGFLPLETPAMESLKTLTGKYGEEGDKLLFKVLNSGDYLSKVDRKILENIDSVSLTPKIAEKGLRYDLTVPFARYVVQHRNEITFPFRRYQIQPVWRADKPQKGRYREFYQCDADVIGSDSLMNEMELIQIIDEVFQRLKIENTIHLNNRKILSGLAEYIGHPDKLTDITVAIDKLDKIPMEEVLQELKARGLDEPAIDKVKPVLQLQGTNQEKMDQLGELLQSSEIAREGLQEVTYLLEKLNLAGISTEVMLDLTLARGLDYYTGAIIEVKAKNTPMGSICGGGRYDDLTGVFGLKDVSGVGISFGADRIYDVMINEDLFPVKVQTTTQIMLVNFGETEQNYGLPLLSRLRKNGIAAEMYPAKAKMKKQLTYANNKGIPFVVMAGENEMQQKKFTIKNMETGEQNLLAAEDIVRQVKNHSY
ncbi:MAG: histidine--tRNA ligase [Bacteroidota bacterium]